MRALVQRVSSAKVRVGEEIVGEIGPGLLTFLGVAHSDTETDLDWLIGKISRLRVFEDSDGKMNLSVLQVGGAHLIVSQFTLYGDTSKGNRPSFVGAANPEKARALYSLAIEKSRKLGLKTESGQFQAEMKVELVNDGPVTFWLESPPSGVVSEGVSA
jgi:D-tyrosyl-tRNA(Tyr) deacylase